MMWVCRPGKNSIHIDYFLSNSKIYLAWDGFHEDLGKIETVEDFKELVIREKHPDNSTSLSNWYSQLMYFVRDMRKKDYVLIPHKRSRQYTLGQITGDYEYINGKQEMFCHARKIKIITEKIPREVFDQKTQYSLGAFRTIFHAKNEENILKTITEWTENN